MRVTGGGGHRGRHRSGVLTPTLTEGVNWWVPRGLSAGHRENAPAVSCRRHTGTPARLRSPASRSAAPRQGPRGLGSPRSEPRLVLGAALQEREPTRQQSGDAHRASRGRRATFGVQVALRGRGRKGGRSTDREVQGPVSVTGHLDHGRAGDERRSGCVCACVQVLRVQAGRGTRKGPGRALRQEGGKQEGRQESPGSSRPRGRGMSRCMRGRGSG